MPKSNLKKIFIKIVGLASSLFLLWGGFYVNLPLGNIAWFFFDVVLAIWILFYTWYILQ